MTSIRSSGTSSARSSARAAASRSSAVRWTPGIAAGSRGASVERSRMAVVSARPMPSAERTPAAGGTRTVRIPRESATMHACCPPAPPKVVRA
ncbi:hypothetical protein ACR6C2_08965 [Streptomyces sp. INA 01156]